MKSKNRRELALMQVEKARKNIELVFDLLYYGTLDEMLSDLKHEIEWLEKNKPLSGEVEYGGEDPTDREIDRMILEKLEKGKTNERSN